MTKIHLVCANCGAINRIPQERLSMSPQCGKCQKALFAATVLQLGETSFDRYVKHDELPLLVDFWAPWCGPCQSMAPAYQDAARELEPAMRLAKVNTEEHGQLAARFNIRSIPTLILFHQGKELRRQSGAMNREQIVHWAQGRG
jgi:thioredoxin 2